MTAPLHVDMVFDTICPWCYIGKRRLEQARALRPGLEISVGWQPFLLNPEIPDEGIERNTYLVKKFGSEARVRRVYGAIAEAGQSVAIDFAFDRIRRTPNTVNSHRLVRYAGFYDKAGAAVEALFLMYFVNGRNIGETDVLLRVGENLGLDRDGLAAYLRGDVDAPLVYAENAHSHRLGINGVPSFIFTGGLVISGAQDPQILARMLDAARETAAAA